MAINFKYTNMTVEEITKEINDRLSSDPRFDNYRESSIVQTLIEIFAGTVDITNYYLQRRAEECFFDTAQLRSSVIMLSRQLGYVVQRPIPATAKIKIKLKGNFISENTGSVILNIGTKIQIPYQSIFNLNNFSFILNNTLSINVSQNMIDQMKLQGSSYESDFITVDSSGKEIIITQGEIREQVIDGLVNSQVGQKFQLYKINDIEFSNLYGENDINPLTTRVWVGNSKDTEYLIDRRSLVNWQNFSTTDLQNNHICLVRTAITEDVELIFGDAQFAALGASIDNSGPQTTFDNIYIQYLSTKGSAANKVGVIGNSLNYGGSIFVEGTLESIDITDKVFFYMKTNVVGGAGIEDIDSIRVNAPNIYYSLDRVVTSKDYISFLKTLTSPIAVKNALAWGEQEEARSQGIVAIKELFNIVFFCCVGELYQTKVSPYYVRTNDKDLDSAVLDLNFDENEISQRNYYNVYVKQNTVEQLKEYYVNNYHYQIFGNTLSATANSLIALGDQTFNVIYASKEIPDISGVQSITISMAGVTLLDNLTAFQNFASQLQTKLSDSTFVDLRETNTTNSSFLKPAMTGVTVAVKPLSSDPNKYRFEIVHNNNDNCYIQSFQSQDPNDTRFLSGIGFTSSTVFDIVIGQDKTELSYKILDVVDQLKERSQVTVQNIYISPVIHNFNIKGKVYIDPLSDKEAIRVSIADSIYNWLNIKNDFNVPVYKSNILELIENFEDVKYANLYFEPEILTSTPTDNSDGTFYNGGNNHYMNILTGSFNPYITSKYMVNFIILQIQQSYLTNNESETIHSLSSLNYNYGGSVILSENSQWNTFVNERNFFNYFIKNVYNGLTGLNIEILKFANSENFIGTMSLIHKDLLYVIRNNMLDTGGNLAPEYDSNGKLFKGGYSLGSEISKMNVQLTYEYKI